MEREVTNETSVGRSCAGYRFTGNETKILDLSRDELNQFKKRSQIYSVNDVDSAATDDDETIEDDSTTTVNEYNTDFEQELARIDGIGPASVDDITEYADSFEDLENRLENDEETPLSDRIEGVLRDFFRLNQ